MRPQYQGQLPHDVNVQARAARRGFRRSSPVRVVGMESLPAVSLDIYLLVPFSVRDPLTLVCGGWQPIEQDAARAQTGSESLDLDSRFHQPGQVSAEGLALFLGMGQLIRLGWQPALPVIPGLQRFQLCLGRFGTT